MSVKENSVRACPFRLLLHERVDVFDHQMTRLKEKPIQRHMIQEHERYATNASPSALEAAF